MNQTVHALLKPALPLPTAIRYTRFMTSSSPPRLGIIGLGIIGSGIARHLLARGETIRVWNRTLRPEENWGDAFASLEDLARDCDVISVYLKDRHACAEVFAKLLPLLESRHLVLNHSTIDVPTCLALAAQCAERGARYVDAPFTGSKIPATNGKLTYYLGGTPQDRAAARDILATHSQAILDIGSTGQATTIKLVTNLVSAVSVQALTEALHTTTAAGISPELLTQAIANNACGSPLAAFKLPAMISGDFSTHFSTSNMLKDSVYVRELARSLNVPTPAIDLVSARMQALTDAGNGELDYCALALDNPL